MARNGTYIRQLKDKDGIYRNYRVTYRKGKIIHKVLSQQTGPNGYLKHMPMSDLEELIVDSSELRKEYTHHNLYGLAENERAHVKTLVAEKRRREAENA